MSWITSLFAGLFAGLGWIVVGAAVIAAILVHVFHKAHHEHLIDWALHRAFSVPDAETFDQHRADLAERAFTEYFGLLPDSDMRRITRHDVVHHNTVYLA